MIELPEALTLARQFNENIVGKTVLRVLPPTKPHKFCWFAGDPADYDGKIAGCKITSAYGFGIYCGLCFDNGMRLSLNDGVNPRLYCDGDEPKNYQLLIMLSGGVSLAFTVAMYGGIVLHDDDYDNEYYIKSRGYVSPFSPEFEAFYYDRLAGIKPSLSAKAFIATEQRFPGIGNGTAQDILFAAKINPRRKMSTLGEDEIRRLCGSIVTVLRDMTDSGGRDTESDIFGAPGGYSVKMSKHSLITGCPECGGEVTKEAYLGGSVYYCTHCQPQIAGK